ncbi:MAG: glycosyltransferase [Schleiferiaceae bacterium]|nr:glycosyltransferase [Schleiferiaceae bacterium]MDP4767793.1 glycosyltransferase [Schleiferiaceae bacterium]MDP4959506.1 glycosyltransferase [Schleiferiaceae bacterium]
MLKTKIQAPVFILGMHRSGTTMVAQALASAGVYPGAICDHNSEPLYAIDINERLLEEANGNWWNVPAESALEVAVKSGMSALKARDLYAAHLKISTGSSLRQWMHYAGPWLVKDPRLSLTLPWWLERFPNAKVIWVLRDEAAVVDSLLRRQSLSYEAQSALGAEGALELARAYTSNAAKLLKRYGVDYRAVHYEDLTSSDEAIQRKTWFSLYQFANVKPGQMTGFTRRGKKQAEESVQKKSMYVLPTDGPLVSVIVPNYNHADYLDERISTIVNQTYQNIEVLLMDDCSPDESRSVLEKWAAKDDRLEVLFNEKNSGSPFAQWARGSAWAKGKYLWIAESDDACALDMLALHVDALERNEKAVMAYSHSHLVDEEGGFLRDFKEDYGFIFGDASRWKSDFTVDGKVEVARSIIFSNTVPNASGVLFRKSVFDQVGAPETSWRLNGDWLFYARLLQHGELQFFATARNYFRFHERTQRSRAIASYTAFDEILAMYDIFEREGWTDQQTLQSARAQVAMWWAGNVFSMKWSWEVLRNNGRLFRVFSRYRSGLLIYLVKSALIKSTGGVVKALGLKEPVKKLAARLFPKTFFPY